MGANSFEANAYGKTPSEAFHAAREHAQWEHGHGGYSGTIAEKGDFVHVLLPAGVTLPAFLKLLYAAEKLSYDGPDAWAYQLRSHERYGVGARKLYGGQTLKQAQAAVAKRRRVYDRFWAKIARIPGLTDALRRAVEVAYGDKWGPALCLGPLTGKLAQSRASYAVGARCDRDGGTWVYKAPRGQKLYLFLGLASS